MFCYYQQYPTFRSTGLGKSKPQNRASPFMMKQIAATVVHPLEAVIPAMDLRSFLLSFQPQPFSLIQI
jgi:hypothetical protein